MVVLLPLCTSSFMHRALLLMQFCPIGVQIKYMDSDVICCKCIQIKIDMLILLGWLERHTEKCIVIKKRTQRGPFANIETLPSESPGIQSDVKGYEQPYVHPSVLQWIQADRMAWLTCGRRLLLASETPLAQE